MCPSGMTCLPRTVVPVNQYYKKQIKSVGLVQRVNDLHLMEMWHVPAMIYCSVGVKQQLCTPYITDMVSSVTIYHKDLTNVNRLLFSRRISRICVVFPFVLRFYDESEKLYHNKIKKSLCFVWFGNKFTYININ